MRMQWLTRGGPGHLLLFFAGWGMDARPFEFLTADGLDVLMCFDYTDARAPVDMGALCGAYETVDLVGWSFGVAVGNETCAGVRPRLRTCVAVNGSVSPIDERYGIPPDRVEGTLANLPDGLDRFQRRMCGDRETLTRFLDHAPQREPGSLVDELAALQARFADGRLRDNLYTTAWVGRQDRIIPAENQARCWAHYGVPCVHLDAPHFPFYGWQSWKELLCPRPA